MLVGLSCISTHRVWFYVSAYLSILLRQAVSRPNVLISGREALPDDDLLPIESGPEPILNLNVGTAPYTSDILHDGIASQAFEDLGNAPQMIRENREKLFRQSEHLNGNGHPELGLAMRKTKLSSNLGINAQKIRTTERISKISNIVSKGFSKAREVVRKLPLRCHDVRHDVAVESGMRTKPDVVVAGLATSAWSPLATSSFLALMGAAESVMVFVVKVGQGSALAAPRLKVSDTSILSLQFVEKDGDESVGELSTVFISQHFCKGRGKARVTVELPLVLEQSQEIGRSGDRICPGPVQPVVFSYMKACDGKVSLPSLRFPQPIQQNIDVSRKAVKDIWRQTVAIDDEDVVDFVRKQGSVAQAPWSGFIPTGGVRVFVIVVIILVLFVLAYEGFEHWVSGKLKKALEDMGPEVFGVKTTLGHTSITFLSGHLTYRLRDWTFHNPEGNYESPHLIHIDEARVWLNLSKMICSCFNQIEILSLVIDGLSVEIEVDGYLMGQPNVLTVIKKMEANNKQFKEDLSKLKEDWGHTGFDPHEMMKSVEERIQSILSRVKLKEVAICGIVSHSSTKLGGLKVALADMIFHDFTEHHGEAGRDAIGAKNIAYFLGHEVLAAFARDVAGVEVGHSRFENMVNSIKSLI